MKFTFNRKIVAPYGDSRGVTASTSGSDPGDGGSTPPGTYFFALRGIDDDDTLCLQVVLYNFCLFSIYNDDVYARTVPFWKVERSRPIRSAPRPRHFAHDGLLVDHPPRREIGRAHV